MKALFLDLARTVVEFEPGFHNEMGSYLRSAGYCISDRDVFREIARQRAWLPITPFHGSTNALDFASLFETLTGEIPDSESLSELNEVGVTSQLCRLYTDIPPFLERAREEGMKIVLIGDPTDRRLDIVKNLGLDEMVDGAAYAFGAGLPRRGSDVFRIAERLAGSKGTYIGDSYEVDSVDADSAELPFILIDRDDYYGDVRANKARSAGDVFDRLTKTDSIQKVAPGQTYDYISSPAESYPGWGRETELGTQVLDRLTNSGPNSISRRKIVTRGYLGQA